ncbi:MAG: glycosyltransferase [Verrucomicrobiaceae bacterium]|nr:glycosyltransferase [Verrucomicrobiaceae bacterium]
MGDLLLIFVKWPEPGTVKTRLAQSIGNQEAVRVYRMLVRAVFKILAPLISSQEEQSEPDSLTFRLLFTPESRRKEVAGWLQEEASLAGWSNGQFSMKAQAGGDLGNRLRVAFEQGFEEGYEQVAAIGTDCVEFDCATIRQSFDQLSGDFDLVFGPAADGGYYLVGMKQPETCKVFDGIPWSSDTTLAASLKVAAGDGYRVHLLKELSDVDTAADWQRVRAHV